MVCSLNNRRKRRYTATNLAFFVLALTVATAQTPPGANRTSPPNRAEVSVCITLRAKHNGQIATLKPTDLALVDAGRPIDSREMRFTPAAGQEPLVTFVFDRLRPPTARNSARAAEKMLSGFGAHSMLLGVWSVGPQLRLTQPYTTYKSAASKAFPLAAATSFVDPKVPLVLTPILDDPADTASAAVLAEARRLVSDSSTSSWSYATLLAAAHVQRLRPGRKAIVLFTEQTNLGANAPDRYRELPEALRDANISLFVVDANALDDASSNQAMLAVAMGGQSATNYYAGLATLHSTAPMAATQGMAPLQFQAMKDTISTLEAGSTNDHASLFAQAAKASGGVYLFADEGSKKLTHQILDTLDSYVTATYPVSAEQQDGRFHSVAVRSTRPDIAIAAEPGYFAASPSTAASSSVTPATPLIEANPASLETGATDAGLHLTAAALHFGHASSGSPTVLAVEVPLPQLRLNEDENTRLFSLHATVAFELVSDTGMPFVRLQQDFRRRGAIETEPTLAAQVLSLQRQVALPPGSYTLNATVRDWNANTFGKTSQTIVVPAAANAAQATDQISDLVIVHSLDRGAAEASSAALQYGDRQVVPNLSGQLAPGTAKTALYFQLYSPPPSDQPTSPTRALSLLLSKDGKLLATLPLLAGETRLDGIATHLFTVTLDRGPGQYEIAVDLKQGTETVTRHASLTLPPSADTTAQPPSSTEAAETKAADAFAASREIVLESGASPSATPALTPEQSDALLAAARENALAYTDKLPNFICRETISRATDRSGTGTWKPRDTIVEALHYQDKLEQRTVLEVDGEKSNLPADHIEGARSNGEFGPLLRAIFDPAAKAQFTWLQSEERSADLLQVFRFNVPLETSGYTVTDHTNSQLRAAFHGLVVVDTATRVARRLFVQTDGLPRDFGVKSSWIAMNYDYVQINNHDYLLPSHGEIGLQQGKHGLLLNRIDFSQYRRFGARSHLIIPGSPDTLQ